MRQMLAQCEKSEPAKRRSLLKKVLLLGTYIKRSANLYFLSSEYQRAAAAGAAADGRRSRASLDRLRHGVRRDLSHNGTDARL